MTSETQLSSIKLALLAKQVRAKMQDAAYLESEPLAIIGIGCRFPGGADNPDAFWQLLVNGVDAIIEVPSSRWSLDEFYDPDPATPGKMNTRWGGFIDDVDQFDPAFFGLSPREARLMDPQQRLFMEAAYAALEDAGQVDGQLTGSQTGIFVASYHNDYALLQYADTEEINAYTVTGTAHSITANRLSYLLNLRGPSISVDTACSSSLVGLHLACQSLRNRECDMALAGGVNLILTPELTIGLSQWGFVAPDGRCKTFDARADGWVRGEGAGVVVLKRLADAITDKDNILAVIRGSAVNQDGRSNVMTAPNGRAQQAVIEKALANAAVSPDAISYVEAHGTGTVIGDPIEVEALNEAYNTTDRDRTCYLGTVKTNIGHLEAAAGIAGVIKTVLAMQHECIPPHLHFETPNPHIALSETPFVIPTKPVPWPRGPQPRLAGVSSFGFGGVNAHVILEEAPQLPQTIVAATPPYLIPISAHTPQALREMAGDLNDYLPDLPEDRLTDLAAMRAHRRNHYTYRAGLVAGSKEELRQQLQNYLENLLATAADAPGKRVFVFSGQGPQWWAMGRELLNTEPIFRELIEQINDLMSEYTNDWSLLAELTADENDSRLDETAVAQPAIFALQVGLHALWQSWGITPHAVVGHSVGEIAAAHVAGIFSLKEAVRIVYHRGRLMQQATGLGKMAAVALTLEEAERLIAPYGDRLTVAAINSPTATVLSGEENALVDVLTAVTKQDRFNRMLAVDYAFHSPQMAPFQEALAQELVGLQPAPAQIPIFSTVTGKLAVGEQFDATYWGNNVRQAVRFGPAIIAAVSDGYSTFLEISPHPVLTRMIDDCLSTTGTDGLLLASLRRQQPERLTMLRTLATLYERGHHVEWTALYKGHGRYLRLPTYPWQRQRYWLPPRKKHKSAGKQQLHPLIDQRLRSPVVDDIVFTTDLSADWPIFLVDHQIQSQPLLPATAYLEIALAAANLATGKQATAIADFLIQRSLPLSTEKPQQVQIVLTPTDAEQLTCRIFSLDDDSDTWLLHAEGQLQVATAVSRQPSALSLAGLQDRCTDVSDTDSMYTRLRERGIDFGPTFQGIVNLWRGNGEALAKIEQPDLIAAETNHYHLHPALLDAGLQVIGATMPDDGTTYVPVGIGHCQIFARLPQTFYSHAIVAPRDDAKTIKGDVILFDEDGHHLVALTDITLHRLDNDDRLKAAPARTDWLVEVDWQPQPLSSRQETDVDGLWLILADANGIANNLSEQLQEAGAATIIAKTDDANLVETIQTAVGHNTQPLRGIVHLAGCDLSPTAMSTADSGQTQRPLTGTVLTLLQALTRTELPQSPRLWLVTRGAQAVVAGGPTIPAARSLWGMAQAINQEHPELRCTCIDLNAYPQVGEEEALWAEIVANREEQQIALHNDGRFVARLRTYESRGRQTDPVALTMPSRGQFDDLILRPAQRRRPGSGEVEIRVLATGMNFRDVLKALDMYPEPETVFGDECAGVVTTVGSEVTHLQVGDSVFGVAANSYSTFVITKADFVVPKPPELSFADAATIPIPFITAHYALHRRGKLQAGERVLIHAAAGGVGQAAVQLAQQAGAEVWGTAGSPEKRAFLRRSGVNHVMNSRTLAFADEILDRTNGRGVDVILNSLNGEFIERSMATLAENGRFLELGKLDIWSAEDVAAVRPNADYHVIFPDYLFRDQPDVIQSMLREIVAGIETGSLKPLPRQVFPLAQVKDAFRFMAQARHIGKIVVTQENEAGAILKDQIKSDAAYLLTGGFGGIGLHVARWLAEQGARHLVLMGRRGATAVADPILEELANSGVNVTSLAADVTEADDVRRVVQTIKEMNVPLRGVIHSAGVNVDGVLAQQQWQNFEQVFAPKLDGTQNLHQFTLNEELDFFILFSSIAALIGSAGQANYAAANAFMDGFAQWRRSLGLPALSINWGAWEDVGMTAVLDQKDTQRWQRRGFATFSPAQGLAMLGQMPTSGRAQLGVLPLNHQTFTAPSPFFAALLRRQDVSNAATDVVPNRTLNEMLADSPISKRPGLLMARVRQTVRHILGFDANHPIPDRQPLGDMGLDSLMAVELRNALSSAVEKPLPATLMFDYPSVTALSDYLKQHLPAMAAPETAVPDAESQTKNGRATAVAELDELSDNEAEALLLAELDQLKEEDA